MGVFNILEVFALGFGLGVSATLIGLIALAALNRHYHNRDK